VKRIVVCLALACSNNTEAAPVADSAIDSEVVDSIVSDSLVVDVPDADAAKTCVPDEFHPPHARDNKCTAADLGELFDACLGSTGSTAACNAFRTAKLACYSCFLTDAYAKEQGAVTQWADTAVRFIDLNIGSCLSALANDRTATSCGAKWDAWTRCAIGRCCAITPFAAFQSCVAAARTNECKDLKTAYDACLPSVANGKMCTPAGHSTPRELFTWAGTQLCVAP
jgi:hypothetical protein